MKSDPRIALRLPLAMSFSLVCLATALLPKPIAAEPSVINLATSTEIGRQPGSGGYVPLRLVEVTAASLTPVLRDVSRDGRRLQPWLHDFVLDVVEEGDGLGPVLTIDLHPEANLDPGTYRLSLEIRGGGLPEAVVFAVETVLPAPPAATLAHEPLALRQVDPAPFAAGAPRMAGDELVLRETGRAAGVDMLRMLQTETKNGEGQPVPGTLRPPVTADGESARLGPVAAGEAVSFRLVAEDFRLGETSGKLQLTAPELAQPLVVPFTLERHVAPLWLLVPVLVGLGLGYFARVWLARRIEIGEVRAQAEALLVRLDRETRERRSPQFQAAVEELRRRLDDALKQPEVESLREEIGEVETALATAIEEFEEHREQVAQRVGALRAVIHPDAGWSLPPETAEALRSDEVEAVCRQVETALEKGRVGDAEQTLNKCDDGLTTRVRATVDTWRETTIAALHAFDIEKDPLVETAKALAATERSAADDALGTLAPTEPDDDLKALVESTDEAHRSLAELTRDLFEATAARIDRLLNVLGNLGLQEPELVAELGRTSDRFFAVASEMRGRPVDALEHYRKDAPALSREMKRAILAQLQGDQLTEAADLLAGGKYYELEQQLDAWLPTTSAARGFADAGRAAPGRAAFQWRWATGHGGVSSTVLLVPGAARVPQAAEARRARTMRELFGLKALRFFIAASLILVAAYFVHEPDWVGTTREWIALFFWAFVLDVTVDTVVTAGSQVTK